MTRDLQLQNTDSTIYPINLKQTDVLQIEKIKTKEKEESIINENRFKRYKKNLQKRARNIL